jgi:hypothetical protein
MDQNNNSLKNLFSDLFAKLIEFSLDEDFFEYLGESLEVFYNLQEGEEYEFNPSEEFLFLTWFLLDDQDVEGYALIDEFMNRFSDELSLQEKQVCKALKETNLTILQVKQIVAGKSMILRDIFLGEEFEVQESSGSFEITQDSILYTRVLRLGEVRLLVGAGIFLDPALMEPLTQFITEQYSQECEEGHMMSFQEFLKQNGELINWWIRAYEQGTMLDMAKDGDDSGGDDGNGGGGSDGDKPDKPDKSPPDADTA